MKRFFLLLGFVALSFSHANAQEDKPRFSDTHKFIFFAVLEGLYNDGVGDISVAAILGESGTENFVIACPICGPASRAVEFYQDRPTMGGKKMVTKTFGPGLTVEERKALVGEPEERRELVQALISRWIEARIAASHLPEEKEKKLRENLRKYRERGTEALKRFQNGENGEFLQKVYAGWDYCPSCNGATLHDPAAEAAARPEAE